MAQTRGQGGPQLQPQGKVHSPDVAVVGGIPQVSADVLEHFLGSGTAPGVEDLHTAHPAQTIKDREDRGPRVDQKLSYEGLRKWPKCSAPTKHQAEESVLFSSLRLHLLSQGCPVQPFSCSPGGAQATPLGRPYENPNPKKL